MNQEEANASFAKAQQMAQVAQHTRSVGHENLTGKTSFDVYKAQTDLLPKSEEHINGFTSTFGADNLQGALANINNNLKKQLADIDGNAELQQPQNGLLLGKAMADAHANADKMRQAAEIAFPEYEKAQNKRMAIKNWLVEVGAKGKGAFNLDAHLSDIDRVWNERYRPQPQTTQPNQQSELSKKAEAVSKKLEALYQRFLKNGKTDKEATDLALQSISEDERDILKQSYREDVEALKRKQQPQTQTQPQPQQQTTTQVNNAAKKQRAKTIADRFEPGNIREAIIQHFAGFKGRLNTASFERDLGFKKGSKELTERKSLHSKNAPTLDQLAMQIAESFHGSGAYTNADTQAISNEIIDVLHSFSNKKKLNNYIRDQYSDREFHEKHGMSRSEYEYYTEKEEAEQKAQEEYLQQQGLTEDEQDRAENAIDEIDNQDISNDDISQIQPEYADSPNNLSQEELQEQLNLPYDETDNERGISEDDARRNDSGASETPERVASSTISEEQGSRGNQSAEKLNAQLKDAQSRLSKAEKQFSDTQKKIAELQAQQQDMFGRGNQKDMFGVPSIEETRATLTKLQSEVKEARAEVEKLTQQKEDLGKQLEGQLDLFDENLSEEERKKRYPNLEYNEVILFQKVSENERVSPEEREAIRKEEEDIERKAKAKGTWLKAPNGKPTNLNKKQWVQVRTSRFKQWFGDWETKTKAIMPRTAKSVSEAQKLIANLVNKPLTNTKLGITATISGNSLSKLGTIKTGENAALHAKAVANIDILFKNADFDVAHTDKKGVYEVEKIHRLGALMFDENTNDYTPVMLTIKEINNPKGNRIYSVEAIDVEAQKKSAGHLVVDKQSSLQQTPIADFATKINALIDKAKNVSKAVDENGEPQVYYHRTDKKFNEFDKNKLGEKSGWSTAQFGFYFSNANQKGSYGKKAMPVFLNIKNPAQIKTKTFADFDYDYKKVNKDQFKNNDGIEISVERKTLDETADKHFVAKEPNQIKSATDNVGTFSNETGDIRHQKTKGSFKEITFEQMGKLITRLTKAFGGKVKFITDTAKMAERLKQLSNAVKMQIIPYAHFSEGYKQRFERANRYFREGRSLEEIWKSTGMFLRQNTNTKQWEWAYRIDQNKMNVHLPSDLSTYERTGKTLKLGNILTYDQFFDMFAGAKDIEVGFERIPNNNVPARISEDGKHLIINTAYYETQSTKTKGDIAHELQHHIQSVYEQGGGTSAHRVREEIKSGLNSRRNDLRKRLLGKDVSTSEKTDIERRLSNIDNAISYINGNKEIPQGIKDVIEQETDKNYFSNTGEREARLAETDYKKSPYQSHNEDAERLGIDKTDFEKATAGLRKQPVIPIQKLSVWHGSPHVFSKFSNSKIGTGEGRAANDIDEHIQYFKTEEGEVYGFVDPVTKEIYIDGTKMNANTPIHEAGHLWTSVIKKALPGLYTNVMDTVKRDTALMNEIRNDKAYSHLTTEEQIADEALARAIGNIGEENFWNDSKLNSKEITLRQKLWEAIKHAWSRLKHYLGKSDENIRNWTDEQWNNATVGELADAISKELLSGKQQNLGDENFAEHGSGISSRSRNKNTKNLSNEQSTEQSLPFGTGSKSSETYLRESRAIARRSSSAAGAAKEEFIGEKQESKALENYAKQKGIWYEDFENNPELAHVGNGNENDVYRQKNVSTPYIYKVNNGSNHGTWGNFLSRIAAHNKYFPSTKYELVGYTRNKQGNVAPNSSSAIRYGGTWSDTVRSSAGRKKTRFFFQKYLQCSRPRKRRKHS